MKMRVKVVAGFLVVVLLTGIQGAYQLSIINSLGDLTMSMYDRELMWTSYSRAAQHDFTDAELLLSKAKSATGKARADLVKSLKSRVKDLGGDLKVVKERADRPEAATLVDTASNMVKQWHAAADASLATATAEGSSAGDKIAAGIRDKLDALTEMAADDGFAFRMMAEKKVSRTFWIGLGAIMLIFLIAGGVALFLTRNIVRPLRTAVTTAVRIASGDLDGKINSNRSDECGEMLRALATMQSSLRAQIEQERATVEERARHEAELRAKETQAHAEREAEKERQRLEEQHRATRLTELVQTFDRQFAGMLQALSSAAADLQATAEGMSTIAEETNRQSSAVAQASERTSANVQTVATATEELSASIGEIASQVTRSTSIAQRAVGEAASTNEEVKGLAAAAQRIGQVVDLISDIASQTNLLALNATIEAARAGEAGKGFAIVASEVKALATQTAKATEDIAGQIQAIQKATGSTVSAIDGIGGTITEISQTATAIASAIEEQGAATQEIARNVQQAASGTQQVSSTIGDVTHSASETGRASDKVLESASEVAEQTNALRAEVDRFLAQVRAA